MKKAIVTGATGFIGMWLVKELLTNNVEVIAIVKNYQSQIKFNKQFPNIRSVICPLNKINTLNNVIVDDDIDVFYNLAWEGTSGVDRSNINLQLNNIQFTCDSVKVASIMGCKKFVNAGSIMEYEALKQINFDAKPSTSNIYSVSKLSASLMSRTLAIDLKIPYINAIISNIYGEGENSARLINTTIRKFLKNEKTVFTEGIQLYDFIYITDAVRAFYLIGNQGLPYSQYYIGNSKQYQLKDFIIKIRDIINPNIELNFGDITYSGVFLNYNEFDTNKIYRELKFEPLVSFEHGIKKTVDWIRSIENDINNKE